MLKTLIRQGATAPIRPTSQRASTSIRLLCYTPRPSPQTKLDHVPRQAFPHSHIQSQTRTYTAYQRFKERYAAAKKDIWRDHPILYPSLIVFIFATLGTGVYMIYDYIYNVEPRFDKYPKPVSNALRKALYYTEIDLHPTKALAWYKQSLAVADNLGMHPFSDEVLGIRFQIAAMLQRAGLMRAAIDVLEKARSDCEEWVTDGRRRQTIRAGERAIKEREGRQKAADSETAQSDEAREAEAKEDKLRDDVMKKVQGIWLKLAELYSNDHVRNAEKTENALIQAVSVSRTELERRNELNLPVSKEDGNNFVNLTHVATAYNELADFYVTKGKSNLATTLYMQALALLRQDQNLGSPTCAQVVLLNNISSQMADQAQTRQLPTQDQAATPLTHEQLLHAASEWAKKALDVAAHIKPPTRDEECDQGCLVATYNLGEIAEMQKNHVEAKKFYQSARKMATELQYADAVKRADDALERLKDTE